MQLQTIQEIQACLPQGKTHFHYYKDRYAAMLLAEQVGSGCRIADLKRSVWGRLLNKPIIRDVCSRSGDGKLSKSDFEYLWQEPSNPFLLSLSSWDGTHPAWNQTTRKGHNLVLQLNFSNQHNVSFQRLVKPEQVHMLRSYGHPVMQPGEREFFRETLAWARIDLDFEHNEALIEEIQNDWLRTALWWHKNLQHWARINADKKEHAEKIELYLQDVLAPYYRLWDEAMLAASIWFILHELGIKTIYYHEHASGAWLKSITTDLPPLSLYSDLPKRFCFTKTRQDPNFLQQDRYFKKRKQKAKNQISWFKLQAGEHHVTT